MNDTLVDKILQWLGRSQFFTYSTLLHVLLIALFGTTALYTAVQEDPEFEAPPGGGFMEDPAPAAPAPQPTQPTQQTQQQATPTPTTTASVSQPLPTAIATSVNTGNQVSLSNFATPTFNKSNVSTVNVTQNITPGITNTPIAGRTMTVDQARGISEFTSTWRTGGQPGSISGSSRFQFDAYVAKYKGGDWNSAHELDKNKIYKGALPNLTYIMNKWTQDRVDSRYIPEPLDLASGEIFNIKPPFILFTGSKDFTLTDKEVENLRKYLLVGGAIWGDSSLPGRNSRFDIAFRREMKRVVSDKDKTFEPLPMDHPVFTSKMKYNINEVPPGLNYYQEPVYVMRIFNEISIIYTSNDYGNMMEIGITEDGEIDERKDARHRFVAINPHLWRNKSTYFRNLEIESIRGSYEFGINMVFYLLTRWEDKLRQFNL